MTTLQQDSKLIITVLLANHADQQHTYDFKRGDPAKNTLAAVIKLYSDMTGTLADSKSIVLSGPHTAYRPEHIIGFQITFQGEEEIAQQIEVRIGEWSSTLHPPSCDCFDLVPLE